MARISPLVVLPPLIFAGLAGLFVWGMQREDPRALPSALVGKPAPALVLGTLPGSTAPTDADLRDGAPKLVNFWASWCAPCRIEHPVLTDLALAGVEVIGVNYKDKPAQALTFLGQMGNPYERIGTDDTGLDTAVNWGVYGVPETFVVAGDGTILYRYAGPLTPGIVARDIRPLLTGDAGAAGDAGAGDAGTAGE
ncbi:DsbE family thiol:disulfide interchange protein [Phaeovulum vinaykumarii]|uniref:Cytochrome c biogenesis protein CcmG, thiol:disulfide interchange protein DsbE n=1 Tax=Phaeovulum vinaykumarii TaxID=407234 RepID=A0A1N7M2L8_9RHOB|nr:DsbE family thiol:disulfide interchange protein [Phaeovulum vinaykumarii]SIS80366.1 cytochrome c biogenesis protein CcmG, thiol:disulfide interchange protein DsbE [Phaeovulum vinaykumarii]SOC09263.1 cytochrome c biogenesis protein CcmG/thiol:disulfide interchange protein DsbE [Phaeovulum vinaykumarii]